MNWFLVCQLPLQGLLALLAYVALAATHYACYGAPRSVGNCTGWSSILLAATAGSSRASPDRCVSFSADDLENTLMIRGGNGGSGNGGGGNDSGSNAHGNGGGSASTDPLSPTAEQPLLAPEEGEDEDGPAGPPGVTVMPDSRQQTPAATPAHEQLVRRRSLDANSFRKAV